MEKILIVEDNKALAKALSAHISKISKYVVVIAHSMEEAKKATENESFLAALLDLDLPDAPNGEVVDYILALNIPSIILTANFDEATKKVVLQKPIIDYVYKDKLKDVDYIITKVERLEKNRTQKVLVVDDSRVIRAEIKNYLSRELYQVLTAANGEEALWLYNNDPDISLVVTDYNMPIMNGLELVEKLREITTKNTLSIVGISSNDETAANFLKFGANDFIKKPFTKDEFVCRVNNAVEALENIKQIRQISITDFLTGIYNRRHFFEKFADYYNKAVEVGEPFALATFDIDNFKSINDAYGHPVGDEVIKITANALRNYAKGTDVVARIGGKEFCVLLKSINAGNAIALIDSIRRAISLTALQLKNGETLRFTVSAGLSTNALSSMEDMIDHSDALLYRAKTSGKNCVMY